MIYNAVTFSVDICFHLLALYLFCEWRWHCSHLITCATNTRRIENDLRVSRLNFLDRRINRTNQLDWLVNWNLLYFSFILRFWFLSDSSSWIHLNERKSWERFFNSRLSTCWKYQFVVISWGDKRKVSKNQQISKV